MAFTGCSSIKFASIIQKKKKKIYVCKTGCTEIFIERHFNLEARGDLVSGKDIAIESEFLDYGTHEDSALADACFLIGIESATWGAWTIPSFTGGKEQLSAKEVAELKKISNVWIHVERVKRRIKTIQILTNVFPILQLHFLNGAMIVICGIATNLNKSVVSK